MNQAIPAGLPLDVRFDVTVTAGTTLAALKADLQAPGAVVIGTDEANADGTLANTHLNFRSAGDVLDGSIPTISQWGLIILSLLLLTGGTIVVRRRHALHPVAA